LAHSNRPQHYAFTAIMTHDTHELVRLVFLYPFITIKAYKMQLEITLNTIKL